MPVITPAFPAMNSTSPVAMLDQFEHCTGDLFEKHGRQYTKIYVHLLSKNVSFDRGHHKPWVCPPSP